MSLAGEDGLTPTGAPVAAASFAFAQAAAAPLSALPGRWSAGRAWPIRRAVVLRVGPGEQRGTLANMNPNAIYRVEGWANDGEGAPWWQLDTGVQKSWVPRPRRAPSARVTPWPRSKRRRWSSRRLGARGDEGVVDDVDDSPRRATRCGR